MRRALRLPFEVLHDSGLGSRLFLLYRRVEQDGGIQVPRLKLGWEVDGQHVAYDRGHLEVASRAVEVALELVHLLTTAPRAVLPFG